MANVVTLRASEWAIAETLQMATAIAYPMRLPTRSIRGPITNRPNAYATWNEVTMYPYWASFQPIFTCSIGASKPSTVRST